LNAYAIEGGVMLTFAQGEQAGRASAIAALLMAVSLLAASGAAAQDSGVRRILSPEETRECVCMSDQIEAARGQLDPLEQEFKRVDELVERARATVNTDDTAEVDSFRRLYGRREALRQQLNAERNSQLGGVITRYNQQCANQRMLKLNVDAVRADPNACAR
jgi:flagellar motility protein MotE (MotC chaperone)